MTHSDKPVGWLMLHHRCTREEAEAMLPYCNDPIRLVLPPVIDRHEVNSYEWSAIASKVESLRRADRDEKVLQERLARRNKREHPEHAYDGDRTHRTVIDEQGTQTDLNEFMIHYVAGIIDRNREFLDNDPNRKRIGHNPPTQD